jgi:hypothetical protein
MAFKIIDPIQKIKSGLFSALVTKIYPDMIKKVPKVTNVVKNEIRIALLESPAIQSLSSGVLKADFGLTVDPTTQIIDAIVNTTRVQYKTAKSRSSLIGSFEITVQPISYSNLYSLGISNQVIKGGSLPWLKWLLEAGDTILIVDFGVEYGEHGRTGMAHMTEANRPFKVNSRFAGVSGDNFITRAMSDRKENINNAIKRALL